MKIRTYVSMVVLMVVSLSSLFAQGVLEQQPIKIGILPDVDSLPFMLADVDQLFDVEVELVMFQSPVERDAAFQGGQVDGIVADTLGALFLEQSGYDISIVSTTDGRYGIAGAPDGNISQLSDLSGQEIGISSNTIIEYLADSLVVSSGVDIEEVSLIAVPKIPVRMELLLNSQLAAACLPEPLYSMVVLKGAKALGDSTSLSDAPGVMIFGGDFVTENTDRLIKVFEAYWEAAQRINNDADVYRPFLVDHAGFSEEIAPVFDFVTYTKPHVPSPQQIQHISDWMSDRELLEIVPSYEDLIDSSVVKNL